MVTTKTATKHYIDAVTQVVVIQVLLMEIQIILRNLKEMVQLGIVVVDNQVQCIVYNISQQNYNYIVIMVKVQLSNIHYYLIKTEIVIIHLCNNFQVCLYNKHKMKLFVFASHLIPLTLVPMV